MKVAYFFYCTAFKDIPMKDKKRKESETESDAFFEVDENIWIDDGDDIGRNKRNSGKRRHRNDSSEFPESGDAYNNRRGSR